MEDKVEEKKGPARRRRKKNLPMWLALAALTMLLLAGVGLLWKNNEFTLDMRLVGDSETYVEFGQSYEEQGVILRFYGSRLLKGGIDPETDIVTQGQVLTDRLGENTLCYCATYRGYQASVQRKVLVVDSQKPVIALTKSPGGPQYHNGKYVEEGFSASDNYDGDLTEQVVRVESAGKVTYTVADSSGNEYTAVRFLPGYDPEAPVITLHGGALLSVQSGVWFEDPGFDAFDNVDGDLTDRVTVEGEVIWYQPGKYPIQYSASDSYGNQTTVVRMVEVVGEPMPQSIFPGNKTIYLTFDDGPGAYTLQLLDILDKYDVKATFFVVDSGQDHILKEIVDRGHSIGIHTLTHDYQQIYASPKDYFSDLWGMQEKIYQATGVRTTLMRFPGGSSNTISYGYPGIMSLLTQAVQDAGFQYFDWNVDSNDAGGAKTANTVLNNMLAGIRGQNVSVVLQHDIHDYSVNAVEGLIRWGLENGYTFLPLTPSSPVCHHDVRN